MNQLIGFLSLALTLAASASAAGTSPAQRYTLDDVAALMDKPATMRDAPAALPAAAPAAFRALGARPLSAPTLLPSRRAPWTAHVCLALSRSLRGEKPAPPGHAREQLIASLREALTALRLRETPKQARVSRLTASAQAEIADALARLESPRTTASQFQQALASVSRAATDLEQAGYRLQLGR